MVAESDANKELTAAKSGRSRAERMRRTLQTQFAPSLLEIEDDSARHAGHAGARPGGETHYRVRMRAAPLAGLSRLERQRAVMAALAAEFDTGLHALSLDLG